MLAVVEVEAALESTRRAQIAPPTVFGTEAEGAPQRAETLTMRELLRVQPELNLVQPATISSDVAPGDHYRVFDLPTAQALHLHEVQGTDRSAPAQRKSNLQCNVTTRAIRSKHDVRS